MKIYSSDFIGKSHQIINEEGGSKMKYYLTILEWL